MDKVGHYAKKQLHCRNRLVSFSHRSRFAVARRLLQPFAKSRLLDYGCGDGTLIEQLGDLFPDAVGADISRVSLEQCRLRLPTEFQLIADLRRHDRESAFDVISCMEVLEHCVVDSRRQIYDDLNRFLKPDGRIIISVPVETGASLLVKQPVRAFAGFWGLGDYQHREQYSVREFVRAILAGTATTLQRETLSCVIDDTEIQYYGHKGFNWRALHRELEDVFDILDMTYSPFHGIGNVLASQVYFICRRHDATSDPVP